ncbi:hypothetical protein HPC49_12785 [Pyxidicoccus fallax]|uniref:Baseplate protein J-like domain-containing protein n=1 Tax=Pyxidicoccus fallax TaxID=394095 RepID=A0A848LA94_9BACT|nr:hypothetical protein [Pyxidicoccus fallax]NMO15416.1 hypothetical protein [Pyxidicoccus fallax]NPC79111.1 hypothetical protein [Pyxidicoccus fallax]
MSRPPRPYPADPTKRELFSPGGQLTYLPLAYADLLELQRALAEQVPPGGEGDFTATSYDLSALVGHVLAAYQNFYAGEVFLRTARTPRSLVKHARRLSYEPDPGLSATGFVHLTLGPGLSGTVQKDLRLASTPVGETKAQDFETTESRVVDAAWNEIQVSGANAPASLQANDTVLTLRGTGHGLRRGEPMAFVGPKGWRALDVVAVEEDRDADQTTVTLAGGIGTSEPALPAFDPAHPLSGYQVLAGPARELRLFGWDASPVTFPPDSILPAGAYTKPQSPPSEPQYGYVVAGTTHQPADWYLSRPLEESVAGDFLLFPGGNDAPYVARFEPGSQKDVTVTFFKAYADTQVNGVKTTPGAGGVQTVTPVTETVVREVWLSGSVTRLRVQGADGTHRPRSEQRIQGRWLTGWRTRVPLVDRVPSEVEVLEGAELSLVGRLAGLAPGMLVALSTLDGSVVQVVELVSVNLPAEDASNPVTTVTWQARTSPTVRGHRWRQGDLKVLGNIVPIVHGKTVEQVLGGSDGITPFLRFTLKDGPLGHRPGPGGGEPDLEVRVHGVAWTRVDDFGASGPEDRHYRLERDQDQVTSVLFGDGVRGAIPPADKKHIHATYRVGLGRDGNVPAGRVTRVVKAHPLVARAVNPVPVAGGTPPSSPESIREQATRHIRTFDRAVSVQDHADLAMLYPGVARASARQRDAVVELVVATADGEGIADKTGLASFLAARRDTTVPLRIIDPMPLDVHLGLYLETDPAFLRRNVEEAIRAALMGREAGATPGFFTPEVRWLGQAASLSEVYARLQAVPGVQFCQITHFAFGAPGLLAVHDVLRVNSHQWLRMTANHLYFTPPSGGSHGV